MNTFSLDIATFRIRCWKIPGRSCVTGPMAWTTRTAGTWEISRTSGTPVTARTSATPLARSAATPTTATTLGT